MVKVLPQVYPPRRPATFIRYALSALLLITIFYYLNHEPSQQSSKNSSPFPPSTRPPSQAGRPHSKPSHPIDFLIQDGDAAFEALISKRTTSIEAAAAKYRQRRGRHPPPGFREWYEFAMQRNAIVVEDFFDQIYHDLEPFWGLDADVIRREAAQFEMVISVRDGQATTGSDWFWTQTWLNMIETIQHLLPDMDIALNAMDEPRMLVPWEDMQRHMNRAKKTRSMASPKDVVQQFRKLPPQKKVEEGLAVADKKWERDKLYWPLARRGCPSDSAARKAALQSSFAGTPDITLEHAKAHMRDGYVANYTLSTDFCHQPDLQGLHGMFIEPLSTAATKVLFPLFGGSKLHTNNDILLPAAAYWKGDDRFTGGDARGGPWAEKHGGVMWRGVATGGNNMETNWKGFHRHRFVSLNNGSRVALAEEGKEAPVNFALPEKVYKLASQAARKLGSWVGVWANVAFTDLMCNPHMEHGQCNYTGPYFAVSSLVTMSDQFQFKYLPDIDGNSFSGRYLGFLKSTSLPIKATLFREWHDARLVPWKHFIPMDSRFVDYYGIMEYFLGFGDAAPAHDTEAERIAREGKDWADRVLRRDDMQIYTLRLLLEYARLCDDRREKMGWVDDLLRR